VYKHALLCAALCAPLSAIAAEASPAIGAGSNAQQTTPTARTTGVQGVVRNANGQPVADARITLRDGDGKLLGDTRSGADGSFEFAAIPPGRYSVEASGSGYEPSANTVRVDDDIARAMLVLTPAATREITITAHRRESARNGLSPKTGGSAYQFGAKDIAKLPQGENTQLNKVLLQAPGVTNDSYGQLHIRGDHGNNQYRINGVILPEGISGFGQSLSTHFAQRINLLTGALPAQYGDRTAGVIEIDTKTRFEGGGKVDLYGGSYSTFNPSMEYGNTNGGLSYFVNASVLTNTFGIESPTASPTPIHDRARQNKAFAYVSNLVTADTKVSLMAGTYDGTFQIPNNPGQTPDPNNLGILAQMGLTGYDSAALDDNQRETNRFAVAALQSSASDRFDYQLAVFTRYSSLHYLPDVTGSLAFNGTAADVFRSSASTGVQADGSYRLDAAHTLHVGMVGSSENIVSDNTSWVFPVNPATGLVNGPAYTIVDNSSKNGNVLAGAYLQDEWNTSDKLTLNYGLRYDQVNAFVKEHQFSPRLGMVYRASDQTSWHAGYARYFTPPPTELVSTSTLALFQNTTGAATSTTNDAVKSERSHYLDAGVTHQLLDGLNIGLDTFYKKSTNVLDEGRFGPALIMTPYNYAEGRIYGAELTLNVKHGDFSGYFNFARTVSRAKGIVSSQFLFDQATLNYAANNWVNVDHAQAVSASTGGSWLWHGTRLSADLLYQSGLRSGFANTGRLPSYTVVNLGAARTLTLAGIGKVEGRLVVLNALDKVYLIRDGSGIGVFAPQYGQRRGVYAGLTKAF
jgi:outer membrane receptor protein involved in Fe transport